MPLRSLSLLALVFVLTFALQLVAVQQGPDQWGVSAAAGPGPAADRCERRSRRSAPCGSVSAGLRLQRANGNAQIPRIQGAERRLAALRQATAAASSNAELNASLLRLNGPVLGPADLANPLPLLKAQVNAVFDQAQAQINRDRSALPPTAFAGFARGAGVELTLLESEAGRALGRPFSMTRVVRAEGG
jgi:hypothetical protein